MGRYGMVHGTAASAAAPSGFSALAASMASARAAKPFLMASWWEPEKEV